VALTCSFCDAPVGAVEPPGSPVSCCRFCALEYLPTVLAEAILTGGADDPNPAGAMEDFGIFLGGFRDAMKRGVGRLLCPERN
jgi:hypothetical protein